MKNNKLFTKLLLMFCILLMGSKMEAFASTDVISLNTDQIVNVESGSFNTYTFTVENNGVIVVHGDFDSRYDCNISILNANGKELCTDSGKWDINHITGKENLSLPLQITPGNYYLKVVNNSKEHAFNNVISIKFTPTQSISANSKITGNLLRNEVAVYKIDAKYNSYFYLTASSFDDPYAQNIELCNSYGECIDDDNISDGDWVKNSATGMYDLKFQTKTVKKGTYYIKIVNKNSGTIDYSIKLATKIPATKIKLNKSKIILKKGKTYRLKATLTPKNSTDVIKWTSSNKKIVTVSKKGILKAKRKGNVVIKAITTSGITKTCKVRVK